MRTQYSNGRISYKELKKRLSYDPYTGLLTRLIGRGGQRAGKVINSRQDGYIITEILGRKYRGHVLAWVLMEGYWPEHDIDHWDRVRDNNKWSNLRHLTRSCNQRNHRVSQRSKTGITGVSPAYNGYVVAITVNNKREYLGWTKDLKQACELRLKAEIHHGYPDCNSTSPAYMYLQGN